MCARVRETCEGAGEGIMKRSPMPSRSVPLRSVSPVGRVPQPLHGASNDPALPKWGRSRMRPVSQKRAKEGAARQKQIRRLHTLGSECAYCGSPYRLHGHERIGMAHGARYDQPDCLLCDPHNTLMEDEPRWAAWAGWKVSARYDRSPDLTPDQAIRVDGSIYTFPTQETT